LFVKRKCDHPKQDSNKIGDEPKRENFENEHGLGSDGFGANPNHFRSARLLRYFAAERERVGPD
jgi:hypothetical protein